MSTASPSRHLKGRYFGRQWREAYGRGMKREEVRLVQAYRGMSKAGQERILALVSSVVLTSYAALDETPPYVWKCDDPSVTGGAR